MRLASVRLAAVPAVFALALFSQDTRTDSISVRMIVVSSAAEAQSTLDSLHAGADFAVLAAEKSVDPTSVDGGLLGHINPSSLRTELRDALTSLQPGQLSKIVRIPSGYAILKVLTDRETVDLAATDIARQKAVLAAGSTKITTEVGGLGESVAALSEMQKPPDFGQDLKAVCMAHVQSFASLMKTVNDTLDPHNANSPLRRLKPIDAMQVYIAKGHLHAFQGEMAEAIKQFEVALGIASKSVPQAVPRMEEMLGISYLHKSEMDNDVYRNPGDRCLFPMPGLRYTQPAASLKAVQHFQKVLDQNPGDLEAKWLLNLAYMTMGQYPSAVPPKYLLPMSAFESPETVGRFKDVAPQAGLNLFAMASGVAVDDFDNDGLFDIVTATFDTCEPMHFFHNNGDGTFTDHAAQAGLSDQLGGLNLIQADYNNDGCMDILVLRGAWEQVGQRLSLLRNNCNGTFTDVTKEAGLAETVMNTQTGVWADINNDGFLDLFVGNESGPSHLFLNNADGTFKDISHYAGVDRSAFTKGVVAADFDHDGFVDFYVSNEDRANYLYHNNHNGTFTEIAKHAGVEGPGRSFATWFFDYDNDGWPDIFVNSYFPSVDETLATYLGLPHQAEPLKLYRNLGNGAFKDVTKEVSLDRVYMPMAANFGDIDNDGYLDVYLGTGNPSYGSVVPNVLLRNKEGKSFADVTASSGTGELHKGHGIAFADIDNDGDEDIITSIGGAMPGDKHAFRLFENPGNGNDWIRLRLVGVKANRAGIGARIKLTVKNEGGRERAIYRTVGSGGSFGASPIEQHIGLGKSAEIERLEIIWPDGSTAPQTFSNVAKDQTLQIRQFAADYTKLERRPFRLGGANR
jgi:tetratricopeptide (TPR) repeat protein